MVHDLIAALRAARLIAPERESRAREIAEGRPVDATAAARLLQELDDELPGFVAFDFARAWYQTADAAGRLIDAAGTLLQLVMANGRDKRVLVREDTRELWISVDGAAGGLDTLATFVDELLAANDAPERVFALATERFSVQAFAIRTPEEIEGLRAGGWLRPLRADLARAVSPAKLPVAELDPVEAGLLAAIHADPDSDDPRLVYADWLIERGDPRGEFIHLQCLHEREPRRVLQYRLNRLLSDNWKAWTRPLDERAKAAGIKLAMHRFRRGFIDSLRTVGRMERFADVLAAMPTLRGIFFGMPHRATAAESLTDLEQLLRHPAWRYFGFAGPIGDAGAKMIAESRALARCEEISLWNAELTNDGLRMLATLPIRSLDLVGTPVDGRTLLGAKSLVELSLHGCAIDVTTLAGLPVVKLRLERCQLSGEQVTAIAGVLPGLAELHLTNFVATPDLPRLPRVRVLTLKDASLGPYAANHLALRDELLDLDLESNQLGDIGAGILADAPALTGLRRLRMWNNGVTEAGDERLACSPYLANAVIMTNGKPLRHRVATA